MKKWMILMIWIFQTRWTTQLPMVLNHRIVQENNKIMTKKPFNLKGAHPMMAMEDKLMIKVTRHHQVMSIVVQENWKMQTMPYQQ